MDDIAISGKADYHHPMVRFNQHARAAGKRGVHIPHDVAAKTAAHPLGRSLAITSAGFAREWRGHYTARDGINEYILIYCIGGRGFFEFEGVRHTILPDTSLVCFPAYAHIYGADEKRPWSIYWAHFTGRDAAELCALASITTSVPLVRAGARAGMIATFNELLASLEDGVSIERAILAAACLRKVFATMATAPRPGVTGDMADVVSYMRSHIDSAITLDEMASLAGRSKYHFLRLFRKETGYAPLDYFLRLRMQRACELLTATPEKIAAVAREVGFSDPYYFSRVFTRIMGVSPRDYRKRSA